MRQIDRLCPLQMGIARDNDVPLAQAKPHQGALEQSNLALETGDFLSQPEAHIECHLVVARPAGMQLCPRRHPLRQGGLDVHVDVLQLRPPPEPAGGDLFADGIQAFDNASQFPLGQQAGLLQHGGVGHRPRNVLAPEPLVEGDGFSKLRHGRRRAAGKSSAAGDRCRFFHALRSRRMCAGTAAKSLPKKALSSRWLRVESWAGKR